jgi:hypothetical protein
VHGARITPVVNVVKGVFNRWFLRSDHRIKKMKKKKDVKRGMEGGERKYEGELGQRDV